MDNEKRKRVVIVGGGFGGLWAARTLARHQLDVLLINRDNYHSFLPLVYQVAAAEIEPEEIAFPLRTMVRNWQQTNFLMAEVINIDFNSRVVETNKGTIRYDYLVLAMGSEEHFFKIKGAEQFTFPLKTLKHGIDLRNNILCCFERAVAEKDEKLRERALTFTIVGGGATGIEFAGALAELVHGDFAKDFPTLDFRNVRIVLLEAADALLPEMPEAGRHYAMDRLKKMGVEVRIKSKVTLVEQCAVHLDNGEILPTETVIWTAGIKGASQAELWGLPITKGGRVPVQPTLQVEGHPEVFVIGDLAYFEQDGSPLPMTAPVAIQEGTAASKNILKIIGGCDAEPFVYKDPGSMVAIGRNAAVVRIGKRTYIGLFAWLLWLGVHIFRLIGFRNRIIVLINWARDYFLYERAVRLILPRESCSCVFSRNELEIDPAEVGTGGLSNDN